MQKLKMTTIVVSAIFCLALQAEDTITNMSRMDQNDGSMSSVAVTDQGLLGTCYAHAVSQASDAYIHAKQLADTKHATSPIMVGLEYKDNVLRRLLGLPGQIDGGTICRTYKKSVQKYGACDQEVVEGLIDTMYAAYPKSYKTKKFIDEVSAIFKTYRKKTRFKLHKDSERNKTAKIVTKYFADNGALAALQPSEYAIYQALKEKTSVLFLNRVFKSLCYNNRTMVEGTKCKTRHNLIRSAEGKLKLIEEMKANISRPNAQPLMISYCAKVLLNGKSYQGIKNAFSYFKLNQCGYHASLVIGARELNGQPQFLIRNSWGKGCAGYSKDWQCENGNIWVDARALVNNLTDYHKLITKK